METVVKIWEALITVPKATNLQELNMLRAVAVRSPFYEHFPANNQVADFSQQRMSIKSFQLAHKAGRCVVDARLFVLHNILAHLDLRDGSTY